MKSFIIAILSFFVFNTVFSSEKENLLKKGLSLSYNFQISESEKIYKKLIENYPDEPEGYLYISQNYLWTYLGNKEEDDFNLFTKNNELAIKKLEIKLAKSENKFEIKYLLGKALMFKAMALTTYGKNIEAFWATKKSTGYFEETLEENPEYYDARLGVGVFQYALDFVPSVFKWAINLTGLTADTKTGFSNILIAYNKGKEAKIEAAYHLGKIYSDYLADYDSSIFYLNKIIGKYPNNTLFLYQGAITYILDRDLVGAERLLNKVISLNNPYFKQTTAFSYFLMGDLYFKRNKYEKAISFYSKFLETTKVTDYIGIANYRLSFCYEMIGKESEAIKSLNNIKNGNDDISDDIFAIEESKIVKQKGWTNDRKIIMVASNFLDAGYYDSLSIHLTSNLSEIKDNDFKNIAYLFLTEYYLISKNNDDALKYLKKINIEHFDREKWGVVYFNYLRALYSFRTGKNSEAVRYIKLADDSNDYYYKDKFQANINNLKSKLKIL